MKTCILHIGMHKTATTSLQATLFESRQALLARGIRYFDLEPNHSVPLSLAFGREGSPHWVRHLAAGGGTVDLERMAAAAEDALAANLAADDYDQFVISGEDLSGLQPAALRALKARLDVRFERYVVAYYVRHPFEYVSSAAQEQLKLGRTLEEILRRRPRARIRQTLETYAAVFGAQALIVRAFAPQSLAGGDIVDDFLGLLAGETPSLLAAITRVRRNDSLSSDAALLLDALNRLPRGETGAGKPAQRPRQLAGLLSQLPGPKFRLTRAEAAGHADAVADDLAFLAAFTDGRVTFDLDETGERYFPTERPPVDLSSIAGLLETLALAEQNARAMKLFLRTMSAADPSAVLSRKASGAIERAIALSTDPDDLRRMHRDLVKGGHLEAAQRSAAKVESLGGGILGRARTDDGR